MKKKFLLFIFMVITFIPNTYAYSKDLIRYGDNLNIKDEVIEGSSFTFGNNISVESKVNGILFEFGNSATNKSIQDYLFLFGNNTLVTNSSFKDGLIFGNIVKVESSIVSRDIYLFGNTIEINNDIGRDAKVFGNIVNVKGKIEGDLYLEAEDITISDDTIINGTLTYPKTAKIFISKDAKINKTKIADGININNKKETIVSKIYSNFISCLNIMVVGIVLMLLFKNTFNKMESIRENIFQNLGIGLLTLLFVPIASIILFTTVVGLSLGLILLVIYFIFIYLSTLITSYSISNYILKDKIKNKLLILIIGVLAFYILKLIPILSTIISIASLLYGLGFVTNFLIKRK